MKWASLVFLVILFLVLFRTLASFCFKKKKKIVLFSLVACCSKLGASSCFDGLLFVLVAFCVYYFALFNGPCFTLLLSLVVLSCCSILRYVFDSC